MKNIDISIIVPIYNTSKYLRKCLDSVINQTKKNIEIILVNDGSTDDSDSIIKSYEDSRIRYYKNQNMGIGKTRNFGIKKAVGKYIMFLDSDDYLPSDSCEKLYNVASKNNADMVVSDYYVDNSSNIKYFKTDSFKASSLKENPNLLLNINLGPCNKIYRRELIVDNDIYFIENYKYEDAPFVIMCIEYSNKIVKVNEALTYYVVHPGSETTNRDKKIFDILEIVEIIRKRLLKYDYLKEQLNCLIVGIITNYTVQQRYQKDKSIRNSFIDKSFDYLEKNIPDYKNKKYYKNRSFFRRKIESSRTITKLYCSLVRWYR